MKQTRRCSLGTHEIANHMNNGLGDPQHVRGGGGNCNYNDGYRSRMGQQQSPMQGNYGRNPGMIKDAQMSVPANPQIEYEVPYSTTFNAMSPVNSSNPSPEVLQHLKSGDQWMTNTPPAPYSNSFGGAQTPGTSPFYGGYNQMYSFPPAPFNTNGQIPVGASFSSMPPGTYASPQVMGGTTGSGMTMPAPIQPPAAHLPCGDSIADWNNNDFKVLGYSGAPPTRGLAP